MTNQGGPPEAAPSQPLVLSELSETATIQPTDLALSLWMLSAPEPPSKVVLPSSLLVRRRLARAGLVFGADRRKVPLEIEGELLPVATALGVKTFSESLPLMDFDVKTSDRMRAVLELESRKPPEPNRGGRRYYWIDGLGVASGLEERESEKLNRQSDQCFFESVDNVWRWAEANRALAVVSATAGGGDDSYNRLHIVVADNGIGIVGSVRRKAEELAASGQHTSCLSNSEKPDSEIAVDVISDLIESTYSKREVVGAKGGHGLSTIAEYASDWNGTMDVISTFAPGRAMHYGRRGQNGKWNQEEFSFEGMQGTLVHLTLDAVEHPGISKPVRQDLLTV